MRRFDLQEIQVESKQNDGFDGYFLGLDFFLLSY